MQLTWTFNVKELTGAFISRILKRVYNGSVFVIPWGLNLYFERRSRLIYQ